MNRFGVVFWAFWIVFCFRLFVLSFDDMFYCLVSGTGTLLALFLFIMKIVEIITTEYKTQITVQFKQKD